MNRVRRHFVAVVLVVALSSSGLFTLHTFDQLRNLSIDALTWLRWITFGRMHEPSESPAVVVVIDEETFNREPFMGTPTSRLDPRDRRVGYGADQRRREGSRLRHHFQTRSNNR